MKVRCAIEDSADFVIVGTGAGGATAARVLAGAGHEVVMVEEGDFLKTSQRPRDAAGAMMTSLRDGGFQATVGHAPMPLLQGKCVGGSTAVNSGIVWRMPDSVRREWIARFGLEELVGEAQLESAYEMIERELEVAETQETIRGGNSDLMEAGARALGLESKPTVRNARRCAGRGECMQGCPGEARQSMDVSYVPMALAHGARLHTGVRVQRVEVRRGSASTVVGQHRKGGGRVRIHARGGVIICAGALHTPLILRRTGLKRLVGDRFQAHPGAAVVGRFPHPVRMAFGATQGYEVPLPARGFKLESLSLPPGLIAARIPGAGSEWSERIGALDHFAQWAVMCRMRAHGTVRPGFRALGFRALGFRALGFRALGASPRVRYAPSASDLGIVRDGITLACRMMFAAGATEVYPGVAGVPEVLTDPRDCDRLERHPIGQRDLHLLASHLFGTACAGSEPSRSVVSPSLETHAVRGLYVMDASVFPTNLGTNPQHSIMAVVFAAAQRLAARGNRRAA